MSDSSGLGDFEEPVGVEENCGCQIGCSKNAKRIRLTFLHRFATPKCALFFLCCASIAQGFVISGLYSVIVTTLEKRFHLHSTETGLIASSYDIASLLTVLIITYVGGRGHKPLWIGWGVFIMGLGSILFSMPHFWAPPHALGEEQHNVCNATIYHGKCYSSHLKSYMAVFVIAQLLHGAGGSTLFTLGVTYLDENVEQVDSSLYHGIYYASSVVGPALGFILGGRFLAIYTDIGTSVSIDETSSLWVGAWWLGFLVGGVVIVALSIPLLLFPRQLPHTEHVRVGREKEMHQDRMATGSGRSESDPWLGEVWRSIRVLFRNPTFLLITFAGALDSALVIGMTIFGPKYLESAFGITPTKAALYFGILAILAGATGQFIGGYIVTKAKLSVRGILKFCAACAAVAFATSFIFFRTCPNAPFAGATVKYNFEEQPTPLSAYEHRSTCNTDCSCNPDSYDPVCGTDNLTYYSPCFAGCRTRQSSQLYTNCTCITLSNGTSGADATAGKCTSNSCDRLNSFLVVFFISILATFLVGTPAIQAILRVVPFTQRSFAIGIKFMILRLFGSIPGPIMFGRVLDLACVVWSTECGKPGSCELYENHNLASHMAALATTIKALVTVLLLIAWRVYKPPPKSSLDRLDEISLGSAVPYSNVGLPTTQDASAAMRGFTRQRPTKHFGVSYKTLKEDPALEA